MVAFYASFDEDKFMVETVVEVAKIRKSCLVKDDTDLLIITLDKTMNAGENKTVSIKKEKHQ